MKFIIFSLLIPLSAFAGKENFVTCEVANIKTCVACGTRVAVSCENHSYNGYVESKIKPSKIQWLISNSKSGTEKTVVLANTSLTIQKLQKTINWKSIAKKLKLPLASNDSAHPVAIQIPAKTSLFQKNKGSQIASLMKAQSPVRTVASSAAPAAGGVQRAKKAQSQRSE